MTWTARCGCSATSLKASTVSTASPARPARGTASTGTAELTWPGGKRIRLVHEDGLPLGGALHHISFTRTAGEFSAQDRERAGLLAKRLGVGLELGG